MAETANPNTTMLEFQTVHFHCKKKKLKHLEINSEPLLTHRKYFLRQSNVAPFYSF